MSTQERNAKVKATIVRATFFATPTDNLLRTLSLTAALMRFMCVPLDAEVVAARPRRRRVILFNENVYTVHLHRSSAREEWEQVARQEEINGVVPFRAVMAVVVVAVIMTPLTRLEGAPYVRQVMAHVDEAYAVVRQLAGDHLSCVPPQRFATLTSRVVHLDDEIAYRVKVKLVVLGRQLNPPPADSTRQFKR
jgi:hypothetical protein